MSRGLASRRRVSSYDPPARDRPELLAWCEPGGRATVLSRGRIADHRRQRLPPEALHVEQALAFGACGEASMARPLLVNPDLPRLFRQGSRSQRSRVRSETVPQCTLPSSRSVATSWSALSYWRRWRCRSSPDWPTRRRFRGPTCPRAGRPHRPRGNEPEARAGLRPPLPPLRARGLDRSSAPL